MARITSKDLFSLVKREIAKGVSFNNTPIYKDQINKNGVVTITRDLKSDVSLSELLTAVVDVLKYSLPSRIIEGLTVEATDPPSNQVIIKAGSGTVGGKYYELLEDVTLTVSLNAIDSVYFINLYNNNILLEKTDNDLKLTVAKIIVPNPGVTNRIINTKDNTWDAYIVNKTEYTLHGDGNGKLEEDTVELLRDNIGQILADNLIGNIRLSEDLKITNTASTLELDSSSIKIKDSNNNIVAKFNKNGTFFYDSNGNQMAKFGVDEARVGNIRVLINAIQSANFLTGYSGFQLRDNGDVEFNNLEVRGTIHATDGDIGGWTIASDSLYATTTGTIKTSLNAGIGANGVILDKDGIRVYDDVLGLVVNLPSNGSAPTFSSGVIQETIFEINTNAVLRTSSTVGDGSANSAGILINNTGLYGCGSNQILAESNLRALIGGLIYLKGEIVASSGQIGGTTITSDAIIGGLMSGSIIRGPVIETSETTPKVRIDTTGIYYQTTTSVGKYGTFQYGDGTSYGSGVTAYLFKSGIPIFSVMAETNCADIRLYNRVSDPGSGMGPHIIGDLICVGGELKICTLGGSPGTFVKFIKETSTLDDLANTYGLANPADNVLMFYDKLQSRWEPLDLGQNLEIYGESAGINRIDTVQDIKSTSSPTFAALTLTANLYLNGNQAIGLVLENRITDPASPSTGQIWYRTDL